MASIQADAALIGRHSVDKHAIYGCFAQNKDILFPTYNGSSFDERMRITSDGSVGIGASAPTDQLDVISTTKNRTIFALNAATGTNYVGSFLCWGGGTANYALFASAGGGATSNYSLYLDALSTGANNYSLYSNADAKSYFKGSLGIGTTTPASKLDVEGGMSVGASYSGTTAAPTNGAIIEGNVGIGRNAPAAKLDVYTTSAGNITVRAGNAATSGTNYGGDLWAVGTGATTNIGIQATAYGATNNYNLVLGSLASGINNYSLYSISAAKSYFAGSVGIGTTAPSYLLELSANSAAKPTSSSWAVISDQSLKTNVHSFTDGLNVVRQINPVWFTYNGQGGTPLNETGVGTIAQALQPICPYMVKPYNRVMLDSITNSVTTETYLSVDLWSNGFCFN